MPARALTLAMPAPMKPAPMTAILPIGCGGDRGRPAGELVQLLHAR